MVNISAGRAIIYSAYQNDEIKSKLREAINKSTQNKSLDVKAKLACIAKSIVSSDDKEQQIKLNNVYDYLYAKHKKTYNERAAGHNYIDHLAHLFKKIMNPVEGTFLSEEEKVNKQKIKFLANAKATPLIFASGTNNLNEVKKLLQCGENVNSRDNNGNLAIHWAATEGNSEIFKLLFPYTDNINICGYGDNTLLNFATKSNKLEILSFLLIQGADADVPDIDGRIPLHAAAHSGNIEIVKLLFPHTKNINRQDINGDTPLSHAVLSQNSVCDVMNYLLNNKADANIADNAQLLPLHKAASLGKLEIFERLFDRSKINVTDSVGKTPLTLAATEGHAAIVKFLLDKGADPNTPDNEHGQLPLHFAIEEGHLEVMKLLAPVTENINHKNSEGDTALNIAVFVDDEKIVEELLNQKNIDVNLANEGKMPPLLWAIENENLAIFKLLIPRANVNICSADGRTGLIFATTLGYLKFVELLLENKADVNIADHEGKTALHHAAIADDNKIVSMLLRFNADANLRDHKGNLPLHYAINNEKMAQIIEAKTTDPFTRNHANKAPRDYVKSFKNKDRRKRIKFHE